MTTSRIVAAQPRDWQAFLALAAAEGWRVPGNEIAFHQRPRSATAWALRASCGGTIGFVTAVPHQRSGWIGNLLVAPSARGRGCGGRLFDFAVAVLRKLGASVLWLTASPEGAPLYRRRGFVAVVPVRRWVRGDGGLGRLRGAGGADVEWSVVDEGVWGESRRGLLAHLGRGGVWLRRGAAAALLQLEPDRQIIGPWGDGAGGEGLLDDLVAAAASGRELLLDAPAAPAADAALAAAGFVPVGETLLMGAGELLLLRRARLRALASLGSVG